MNLKKVLVLAGVAFILFMLITQPDLSAHVVKTILGWFEEAAESLVTFVKNV